MAWAGASAISSTEPLTDNTASLCNGLAKESLEFPTEHKYLCTIRSTSRGKAELIVTEIGKSGSQVYPLRWRQLLMLIREAGSALDAWPLSEQR